MSNNKEQEVVMKAGAALPAEEVAAISAAVYMFLEQIHDIENAILTINKSAKTYSPWSSKIYSTHNFQRR